MKIACVLGPDFEDSEFRVPFDRFVAAGHQVTVIGLTRGAELRGKKGAEKVTADLGIDQARPEDFDALFIPGGHSPDALRGDERMVAFTQAFGSKPIFAVCHGPQLLLTAGMVKDHRMTAWKTVQGDLQLAGAQVLDKEVVVDGNLVTSRKPDDLDAFTRESLRMLTDHAGVRASAA
jgi:protease I